LLSALLCDLCGSVVKNIAVIETVIASPVVQLAMTKKPGSDSG